MMKRSTLIRISLMFLVVGMYMFVTATADQNTLVIGTTDVVGDGGLEVAQNFDFYGFHVAQHNHEGLCTLEPSTSKVIAELTESCDPKDVISNNGLTYSFKVRSGVTFTDGTSLTAANVAFSFNRNLALNGDPVQTLLTDDIKDVKVTGPLTVQITMKQPDATFLSRVAGTNAAFILSFNSLTKDKDGKDVPVDKTTGELKGTPDLDKTVEATSTNLTGTIGTGPYVLKQYVAGQLAVFEAYSNYWGCAASPKFKCPSVRQIIEEHFNTSPALSAALQDGSVDIAWRGLAIPDINALQGNAKFSRVQPPGSSSVRYINFGVGKAPYDDLRVRKAVSLAVDRDAIVSKVFGGVNKPIFSMVPAGFPGQVDVFPKRDVAAASKLLQDAGYSASKPAEVDLWFETSGHYGTTEPDVAAVVAASLGDVKELKVKLQPIDFPGLRKGNKNGTISFFFLGWFPDFLDPIDFIDPFIGSGTKALGIYFNDLADKGFDALPATSTTATLLKAKNQAVNAKNVVALVNDLLTDATVKADPSVRNADLENLQRITADVVPQIPLWGNLSQFIILTQKNIGGVVQDASLWLRDWLITKSK
ncbi:hypothetical protein HY230_04130 [Candidatus Acetothermia bacterium]|nr:hypothetical protein [Candidatus Acetothermia bacterium]